MEGQPGEFDRAALNPVLRDMGPEQINELFNALLKQRGQGEPAPAPQAPKQPELPDINLKEVMDPSHESYNPELALKYFVTKNYGSLLSDINGRSVKAMYGNFRNQLHDFGEFESEIDQALGARDPSTLTEKDVFGTYLAIKGMRVLAKERQERAAATGRTAPAPSPQQPVSNDPVLDEQDREMARLMFPKAQDPEAKYMEYVRRIGEGAFTMKVPVGDGKSE